MSTASDRVRLSRLTTRALDLAGHPGLLLRPRGARALYLFAHGAGAGMRHPFMAGLAEALGERGIATLRWELPYMARGAKRVDSPAISEAAVREAWTAAPKQLPAFAGGKSFGGRMTSRTHAATPLVGLRGLIFVGFPLHPDGKPAIERAEHLAHAAGPMLFVQGSRDALAEPRLLRPIVASLGTRATLHELAGADHGFTRVTLAEIADPIASWIDHVLTADRPRR